MAKVKKVRLAGRERRGRERWLGVREEMDHIVVDDGRAWRPDVVAWFSEDGRVLSTRLVHPEAPESVVCDALEEAMTRPLPGSGSPRRPQALEVADDALYDAVVARYGGAFTVSVGDVAVADQYLDSLTAQFGSSYELVAQPMLAGELVTPMMVRAYLDAMRELYRAVPWAAVDEEHPATRLRVVARGIEDGCATMIADPAGRGFAFFHSVADYERGDEVLPRPERPRGARRFVACFDIDEIASKTRFDELERLGWDKGFAPGWVPGLAVYDYGNFLRPIEPEDVDLAIVCARALAAVARSPERADDEEAYTQRVTCEGLHGAVEVEITTPHPGLGSEPRRLDGVSVTAPSRADIDEVVDDFMIALERSDDIAGWRSWAGSSVGIFLQHVAELGSDGEDPSSVDLSALTAGDVEEFLLDFSPRKVTGTEASIQAAPPSLARFFAWLKSEGYCPAARCDEAVAAIERVREEYLRRSRDRSRFGTAKSFFMGMLDRGMDIHDPRQIDAYSAMLNREAIVGSSSRVAAPTKSLASGGVARKTRWEPAPGEPFPAADAPCPCGSGRRYKKCCRRR